MFINNKGKLFGKISIIDIIVILGILVASLGIYTVFTPESSKKIEVNKKDCIECTLLIRGVRQGTLDALKEGGPIMYDTTKDIYGKVLSVSAEQATDTWGLPDGTLTTVDVPGKYDLTVNLSIDGSIDKDGFYNTKKETVNIGSSIHLVTKYASTWGLITDVRAAK